MSPEVPGPYGVIRDVAVAVSGDTIRWIGPEVDAPAGLIDEASETLDLLGGWVTPGLIDAHTHLVFGGNRANEFELRLGGATYEELARAGGGILSTVSATRAADAGALESSAGRRLATLIDHGVTTAEVKSGYGLDVETELRMLSVARSLASTHDVSISTTLLAAHALPAEFRDDRAGYIDLICAEMIPEAARNGLADAVDAFCEGIGFTPDECARVLTTGWEHGLGGRLHAEIGRAHV